MTTGKEEHVKWIMKDNSMRPYMKHWNVSERRESFPLMCRDIKRGRGNPELAQLLGEKCVGLDVNSMKPLDNLCHPVSVIREAEELAADAFGAAHAFLMVGGTTSAVQSMILSVCKAGDKIILPRKCT